ncbi:MAG: hypothetical protein HYV63_25575 [Candidatus Schekmanbacteria bacterium]|nr:hypothetical protein [Candidatus Schekmanbacteria bacterium]
MRGHDATSYSLIATAGIGAAVFALSWWAFSFPLTYCDSPSWSPSYVGMLLGRVTDPGETFRGVSVTAWFHWLGAASIHLRLANAIGLVQACLLVLALLIFSRQLWRGAVVAELVLVPALLLSVLRLAIYSQALLSEALAISLLLGIATWVVRSGGKSLLSCAAVGLATGYAVSGRLDLAYLAVVVLGRIAVLSGGWRARVPRLGAALGGMALVVLSLQPLSWPADRYPIGKIIVLAEWARYSEPPRTDLAAALESSLTRAMAAKAAEKPMHTIYDGLGSSRAVAMTLRPSWSEVLRLLAYDLANRPAGVIADRIAVFANLYATGYAAFWPGYPPWGTYYFPYREVFSRWSLAEIDGARYSCPEYARLQSRFYQVDAVRSGIAVRALQGFHETAQWYARSVLRCLYWLAIPAAVVALARRRGGARYRWLTALVGLHFFARAVLVCADERYQLPIDFLAVWWLALTIRTSLPGTGKFRQAEVGSGLAPAAGTRPSGKMRRAEVAQALADAEARLGLWGAAMLVGVFLLGICTIYVTPATQTVNHGALFESMSVDPFDFSRDNRVQLRILTPLVAHILFFRGPLYIFFPILVSIAFLGCVYAHFRREEFSHLESLGASAMIAFSTTLLFTLHFQGYTDTTSYVLVWLCLTSRSIVVNAILFSLALLNHESNLFCFPFLVYRPWEKEYGIRRAIQFLLLMLIACIPAQLYRSYVLSHADVMLTTSAYIKFERILHSIGMVSRLLTIGIFESFRAFWIVPVFAVITLLRKRIFDMAFWICLVIACASLQLLIATDTSRLLGLAFPAVLFGAKEIKKHAPDIPFERCLWVLIIGNFIIPIYYVGQDALYPFLPLPISLLLELFGINAWQLWWK